MAQSDDVPAAMTQRLRAICARLPGSVEEQAWVGVRWQVAKRTFAHVLRVTDGWPPAYARAAGGDGPMTVLMFRASGEELEALRTAGRPFFPTPWRPDEVGMVLDDGSDWSEITELVTESHRIQAPRRLRDTLD